MTFTVGAILLFGAILVFAGFALGAFAMAILQRHSARFTHNVVQRGRAQVGFAAKKPASAVQVFARKANKEGSR